MIIRIKIDVKKLLKEAFFEGKNGALWADITLLENKGGPDRFGNDFMCVQDLGQEARKQGKKGPILGNGKYVLIGDRKPVKQAESSEDVNYEPTPMQRSKPAEKPADDGTCPF